MIVVDKKRITGLKTQLRGFRLTTKKPFYNKNKKLSEEIPENLYRESKREK